MKHIRNYFVLMTVALSALAHAGGDASDGHSHGEATKPSMTADVGPRPTTQTEEFELVAVLEGRKLTLYLDRFATNEPVADAQVEVESGTLKAAATQVAPGVYSLSGEAFANPGKYPLAILVQAGDSADLLTVTLDLPQAVAGAAPIAGTAPVISWSNWAVGGAAGALLLCGAAFVAVRRRKNSRRN